MADRRFEKRAPDLAGRGFVSALAGRYFFESAMEACAAARRAIILHPTDLG